MTMLEYYDIPFYEISFHYPITRIYKIQDKIHEFCQLDWNFEGRKFGILGKIYKKLLC